MDNGNLTVKDADKERSKLSNILKGLNQLQKLEIISFLNNRGLLLSAREKFLTSLEVKYLS